MNNTCEPEDDVDKKQKGLYPTRVKKTNERKFLNVLDEDGSDSSESEMEIGAQWRSSDAPGPAINPVGSSSLSSPSDQALVNVTSNEDVSKKKGSPKISRFAHGHSCPTCVFYTHNMSKLEEKIKKIDEILEHQGQGPFLLDLELILKFEKCLANFKKEVNTLRNLLMEINRR